MPDEDWTRHPPDGRTIGLRDLASPRIAPESWDVTELVRARQFPGLGQAPTGVGYMLIGEPVDIDNLTADDNTRCTSLVSDLRLEVTYTIPPLQEEFDPVQPH